LDSLTANTPGRMLMRTFAPLLKGIDPGAGRSAYDRFMLPSTTGSRKTTTTRPSTPRNGWKFPPGSSWMVYTDTVPHSVLSGQYALEQTYIVPVAAMVAPEHCADPGAGGNGGEEVGGVKKEFPPRRRQVRKEVRFQKRFFFVSICIRGLSFLPSPYFAPSRWKFFFFGRV